MSYLNHSCTQNEQGGIVLNNQDDILEFSFLSYYGQVGDALLYSRLQVGHCIMDCIKLEFNDIISLYKKNDSERRRYVSLGLRHIIYISIVFNHPLMNVSGIQIRIQKCVLISF